MGKLVVSRRKLLALAGGMALGAVMSGLGVTLAYADPEASQETLDALSDAKARYDAAEAKLEEIGSQLEELGAQQEQTQQQVDDTQSRIDETQSKIEDSRQRIRSKQEEIDQKQREIQSAQDELGRSVAANYKTGGISIVDIVVNSGSLDELANSIYYSDKIAQSERDKITRIKGLKSQLEGQRAQLEEEKARLERQKAQLEEQKARLEELKRQLDQQAADTQAKQQEAKSVVDGLDQEVKDLIARRDAEIQAAREEEQRRAAEAAAMANYGAGTPAITGSGLRERLCNAALSLLGVPYVWGGTYPQSGGTDCSGLMQWAFAQCGYSIPRTAMTQLAACRAAGHVFFNTSQLQPGDLVFVNGGHHVAMYLGNSRCVHEPSPGGVCMVSPLSRWGGIYALGFPLA